MIISMPGKSRRPGRRETGDVSGKFVGKNEEGKGKEEGKMRKDRERRGKKMERRGKERGKERERKGEEHELGRIVNGPSLYQYYDVPISHQWRATSDRRICMMPTNSLSR